MGHDSCCSTLPHEQEDYYYDSDDQACNACPDETTCPRGTTLSSIYLNQGYWRHSAKALNIYNCPANSLACGGSNITGDYCVQHAYGPYCAMCEVDYYKARK